MKTFPPLTKVLVHYATHAGALDCLKNLARIACGPWPPAPARDMLGHTHPLARVMPSKFKTEIYFKKKVQNREMCARDNTRAPGPRAHTATDSVQSQQATGPTSNRDRGRPTSESENPIGRASVSERAGARFPTA